MPAENAPTPQLPDHLKLRHRRRARAEDPIWVRKDTGLTNLPLHDLTENLIWCATVMLTPEPTAWMHLSVERLG